MILRNTTMTRAVVDGRQAERLAPPVQVSTQGITSFGSVADFRGYSSNSRRMPSSFTVTCNNTTTGALEYVIGDPNGMVAGKTGRTFTQPTSAQSITVAALQNSFRSSAVLIKGINYNTSDGAVQFSRSFRFADADYDRLSETDIFSVEAERNTSQNPNLLTLSFKEPFELDWNSAFLVNVAAGEFATLTFFIGAASGR